MTSVLSELEGACDSPSPTPHLWQKLVKPRRKKEHVLEITQIRLISKYVEPELLTLRVLLDVCFPYTTSGNSHIA